jgi:D-alanyl-D-alanine carboxypeptidase/D-alanyl-D-alanine-endopeptidase (penicillin-binding protein 4)
MRARPAVRTAAARLGLVAAVLLPACASGGRARTPGLLAPGALAAVIDSIVTSPPLERTQWGIAVRDNDSGEWLARLHAEKHFVPASNTKLIVTVVAMGVLGPAWHYETPVFAKTTAVDSTADELIIVGRGDPTFSARFQGSDFALTDALAEAVFAAGIRRVGEIVIDATFFADAMINGTWEVGDLPENYAPPIDALAIAEGTFGLVLKGGVHAGEPARVETTGAQGLQPIEARITTDTAGARTSTSVDYLTRRDAVVVQGTIGAGRTDTTRLAVTEPARFAARAIEVALRARGVSIDRETRVLRDSAQAARLRQRLDVEFRRIATFTSPPLTDIVAGILRPSQNWMAEMLLKTLGGERRGSGSWRTGLEVEREYLNDVAHIDSTHYFLRDGSGLSPQNLLAPDGIVMLLDHARRQPWGQAYREALPEPGLPGGTLETRLLPLRGRLRAKTGSITNVNTISGYIITEDGHDLSFSIMTNASGVTAAAVRRGMDRIITALAQGGALR